MFWVCLFALNQYRVVEEVGSTPEEGLFNLSLKKTRHGAVMVIDGSAEPMSWIWCLYEVARAKHYEKLFQLIVDKGDLVNASVDTWNEISESLLRVRASEVKSSNELDRQKIYYRILNPVQKIYIYHLRAIQYTNFKVWCED